jgi:hypothetical protein
MTRHRATGRARRSSAVNGQGSRVGAHRARSVHGRGAGSLLSLFALSMITWLVTATLGANTGHARWLSRRGTFPH